MHTSVQFLIRLYLQSLRLKVCNEQSLNILELTGCLLHNQLQEKVFNSNSMQIHIIQLAIACQLQIRIQLVFSSFIYMYAFYRKLHITTEKCLDPSLLSFDIF